jgi:peptidoglycan/LPS O-acetylase OafA/YrhL
MPIIQRMDIQIFRGISVLAVVLFHANQDLFQYGYLGVDAFFVISGFVITPILVSTLFNNKKDIIHFYKRRFFRLAPGLSSFLLLITPVFFLFDPIYNHALFAKQGISSLLISANLAAYSLTGDYFSQDPNPLIHLWSLSVEAQIYLVFPVLLFFLKRKFLAFRLTELYCVTTILSATIFLFPNTLNFLFQSAGIQNIDQLSYYLPTHRIWQFTCGGLVYLCSIETIKKARLQKILLLIMIFLPFVITFTKLNMHRILSIYLTAVVSLLILIKRPVKLNRITQLFVWLGDRSYSIYLFHLPILFLVNYSPIFRNMRSNFSFVLVLTAILFSFFLGSCNYHLVENRYRVKKSSTRKKQLTGIQNLGFILLPMIILNLMLQGSRLNYFGLNFDSKAYPIYPGKIDDKCYEKSKEAPCVYISPSSGGKKLMLIGNSFAGHFAETTKVLSEKLSYDAVIWTDLKCSIDIPNAIKSYGDSCIRQNKILQEYITNTNPDVIILSEFIKNTNDLERIKKVSLDLVSPGRKIVLIENNPIFPDRKNFMRYRPILSQIIQPKHKMDFKRTFPINQMELSFKLLSDELSIWGAKNNIAVVRSWDTFCNEQECTRYDNGVWLYSDYNHLSFEGANKLLPLLTQSIQ